MADFCEFVAKPLLAEAGIRTPEGEVVSTPEGAAEAFQRLGPCMVKVQIPTGQRGKAGGIVAAASAEEAHGAADRMLGTEISGYPVDTLLVEKQARISREYYASIINDPVSGCPLILFSTAGGMNIEEASARAPQSLVRLPVDIRSGPDAEELEAALSNAGLQSHPGKFTKTVMSLYGVYRKHDAELIEINPLAELQDGEVAALDCKLVIDDASLHRQPVLAGLAASNSSNEREAEARSAGLTYIELDGSVGILANGAGLTMTTMDVVSQLGGRPGNFLEIGGEAYTKGKPALEILLKNPRIKSLLVNFCGAFARTDVMAESIAQAWLELKPDIPVFFTVHGTGSKEAVTCIRQNLGLEPFEKMDDAVRAAVRAAEAAH